jgi:hypothetical protein
MRKMVLVSMPETFTNRFFGLINNINATNSDKEVPIRIENTYDEPKIADGVTLAESNEEEVIDAHQNS